MPGNLTNPFLIQANPDDYYETMFAGKIIVSADSTINLIPIDNNSYYYLTSSDGYSIIHKIDGQLNAIFSKQINGLLNFKSISIAYSKSFLSSVILGSIKLNPLIIPIIFIVNNQGNIDKTKWIKTTNNFFVKGLFIEGDELIIYGNSFLSTSNSFVITILKLKYPELEIMWSKSLNPFGNTSIISANSCKNDLCISGNSKDGRFFGRLSNFSKCIDDENIALYNLDSKIALSEMNFNFSSFKTDSVYKILIVTKALERSFSQCPTAKKNLYNPTFAIATGSAFGIIAISIVVYLCNKHYWNSKTEEEEVIINNKIIAQIFMNKSQNSNEEKKYSVSTSFSTHTTYDDNLDGKMIYIDSNYRDYNKSGIKSHKNTPLSITIDPKQIKQKLNKKTSPLAFLSRLGYSHSAPLPGRGLEKNLLLDKPDKINFPKKNQKKTSLISKKFKKNTEDIPLFTQNILKRRQNPNFMFRVKKEEPKGRLNHTLTISTSRTMSSKMLKKLGLTPTGSDDVFEMSLPNGNKMNILNVPPPPIPKPFSFSKTNQKKTRFLAPIRITNVSLDQRARHIAPKNAPKNEWSENQKHSLNQPFSSQIKSAFLSPTSMSNSESRSKTNSTPSEHMIQQSIELAYGSNLDSLKSPTSNNQTKKKKITFKNISIRIPKSDKEEVSPSLVKQVNSQDDLNSRSLSGKE